MELLKKMGAVVFALALFVGLVLVTKTSVKAVVSEADLQIKTLVSTDQGRTWTTDACAPSGQTVQIRTTIWNEGGDDVYKVNGATTLNNESYLRDCTPTNTNEDGDNYGYTTAPFADGGELETGFVGANGTETTGEQSSIVTCRIEAPCEEIIRGTVVLTRSYTDDGEPDERLQFMGRALAALVYPDADSNFTVRVAGGVCPRTCGSSSTTTSLPQTGNPVIELVSSLF